MFWNNKKKNPSIINLDNIIKFIHTYAKGDNWHNIDAKSGNLGYAWLHYSFIRNLRPNRILVVGSRFGYIPAICAMACKDNNFGVVDFVDAGFDMNSTQEKRSSWGGVGFWKNTDIEKHFESFGLNKFISVHVTTTSEFHKLHPKRKWGYIYLDGDHSFKGVSADFNYFYPSLNTSGVLCLHDIHMKTEGESVYGVWKLWKNLIKEKKYHMLDIPGNYGLGIIQKY